MNVSRFACTAVLVLGVVVGVCVPNVSAQATAQPAGQPAAQPVGQPTGTSGISAETPVPVSGIDAGRQHFDFVLFECVEHRTPAGVRKHAKPPHERFDFERCRADEKYAQNYFLRFGFRMLIPPMLRNCRGVIMSSIS